MASVTIDCTKDASAARSGSWSGWSGSDQHQPVGGGGAYEYASFFYFPINWTGMTSITSATLKVYGAKVAYTTHTSGSSSTTVYIRRMTSDWGEGSSRSEGLWGSEIWTWDNRVAAGNTTTGQISWTIGPISNTTAYTKDITSIVQSWAPTGIGGNGYSNYGILLKNASSADADAVEFYSRTYSSGQYIAELTIVYETNTAPNAPTDLDPGSTNSGAPEVITTLSPTFTGSFSDPDAGDSLTGAQVRLYSGTTQTTMIWDSGTKTASGATFSIPYSGTTALIGNSTYNWQARTKDEAGVWGPWSGTVNYRYFKPNSIPNPPTLRLSQSPTTDVLTLTPTFNITHSDPDTSDTKMSGYRLIVQKGDGTALSNADTGDVSVTAVTTKSVTYGSGDLTGAAALDWNTQYRWRARTKDSNGAWGPYSSWAYFTTHKTAVPITLDPTGSEDVPNNGSGLPVPVFSGARGDSDDVITGYQIEIYDSAGTTEVWDSGTKTTGISNGATFAYTLSPAGDVTLTNSTATTYKWRVRVTRDTNKTSAWSDWSALQTFKTQVTSSVYITAPTAANLVTTLTPSMQFARSAAFRYYRIIVQLGEPPYTLFWDSGNTDSGSSATSKSITYAGTALTWATSYRWRVKVSSVSAADLDNQTYCGYVLFSTDFASTPTISTIGGAATSGTVWITDTTPDFVVARGGSDTIDKVELIVYNSSLSEIWRSNVVDVANATTGTVTYGNAGGTPSTAPTLVGGNDYSVRARITKSTGPVSAYSGRYQFRINGLPNAPTTSSPPSVWEGTNPVFTASFGDPDVADYSDYPTSWNVYITDTSDALVRDYTQNTTLEVGDNTWTYSGSPTLSADTTYKWKTRFKDSKDTGTWGAWSGTKTFTTATAPTITISSPSEGSNVTTTRPTIEWSITNGKTQSQYDAYVYRNSDDVLVYHGIGTTSTTSIKLPGGYLRDGNSYTASIRVKSTQGLWSAFDTQSFNVVLNAPAAIAGVSATIDDYSSSIRIDWDISTVVSDFGGYRVYRRRPTEDDYELIASYSSQNRFWHYDYYAGNGIVYEYMVTQVKTVSDELEIESPDSDAPQAFLSSDAWIIVGADRTDDHIFEIPVIDEDHQRPVQQEVFEPLGTDRKTIVRGSVLGHEGTLECQWDASEAAVARERIEYLYANRGPHILKSPFGEVFDVEFSGPSSRYMGGGHLSMTLSYIETGFKTSNL